MEGLRLNVIKAKEQTQSSGVITIKGLRENAIKG